jgi:hypothetical protein
MSTFNPFDPFNDEEFEFELVEAVDPEDIETRVQAAYKKQMHSVEKLIVPLLKNLMKNPDVETIKWPNRTEAIKTQMSKITNITRSKLEF